MLMETERRMKIERVERGSRRRSRGRDREKDTWMKIDREGRERGEGEIDV